MRKHFDHEMAELGAAVTELGNAVCRNVAEAVESLRGIDKARAVRVMRHDREIDLQEVRNEETCLKIIALHQPVADDLRYLIVMLKVNHELERIGDLAVEIAKIVHLLDGSAAEAWGRRLAELAATAAQRLRLALAALLAKDAPAARDIWLADSEINATSRVLAAELQDALATAVTERTSLFGLWAATMHVERLADHVKNIAKDVIYLVLGEIARHRSQHFLPAEARDKKSVLFVCIHNSARSQMAEAWLNHRHGDRFEARSAGLEPGALNPVAVAVMREVGIDMAGNSTKDVFEMIQSGRHFDYLITVCDEAAAERCPPAVGTMAELHWSFPDPGSATGGEQEQLEFVRTVRDDICRRIDEWAARLEARPEADSSS